MSPRNAHIDSMVLLLAIVRTRPSTHSPTGHYGAQHEMDYSNVVKEDPEVGH